MMEVEGSTYLTGRPSFQWADMVKMRDASAHGKRKEDIHLVIARSRVGALSSAPPSSPKFGQQDPLEDDVVETQANGDVVDDDDAQA